MGKRCKTGRLKKNKSYTIEELAAETGVSIPTVRNWIQDGMPCLMDQRPYLVIGFQAKEYLCQKRSSGRKPLGPCEIYCFRCKTQRMPAELFAEFIPLSDTGGRLQAFCDVCECFCNRNISTVQLVEFSKILEILKRANE
jgi:hypothetical protein